MPAATPAMNRPTRVTAKSVDSAVTVLPSTKPPTPTWSRTLRRQLAVAIDSGIAESAVAIAYTVTVCPVAASLTPRSLLMATSTPAGKASVSTVTKAATVRAHNAATGRPEPSGRPLGFVVVVSGRDWVMQLG